MAFQDAVVPHLTRSRLSITLLGRANIDLSDSGVSLRGRVKKGSTATFMKKGSRPLGLFSNVCRELMPRTDAL